MPIQHFKMLTVLAGLVLGLVGCYYTTNNLLQPATSVKIIVKGLEKASLSENFKVHISGVNLGVSQEVNRSNHFSINHTYKNLNELVKGLEIEQNNLSQGKWRIAIELIEWKTACSTIIQDKEISQLIFSYQEHLCP